MMLSECARISFREGDKIIVCGEEYQLYENLYTLKGFQFRTWLLKGPFGRNYVAKITTDAERALRELSIIIYLKTKGYPERYYAELLAFDHRATLIRRNNVHFYVILLKYLPQKRFRSLNECLDGLDEHQKKKLAKKIQTRVRKLHKLGISHGDIREHNIMVESHTHRMGVRLIDFGLSTFSDEKEKRKDDKRVEKIVKMLDVGEI